MSKILYYLPIIPTFPEIAADASLHSWLVSLVSMSLFLKVKPLKITEEQHRPGAAHVLSVNTEFSVPSHYRLLKPWLTNDHALDCDQSEARKHHAVTFALMDPMLISPPSEFVRQH